MMLTLLLVAALVALINVPFGFWRRGTEKFSPAWFAAIHLPIPLVVMMRLHFGLGWRLSTFPLMIGAYFSGQYFGGLLQRRRTERGVPPR